MHRTGITLRRSRTLVLAAIVLTMTGYCVTAARAGEEPPSKILTVEKLGGPEAAVGDAVAASLETGRKVQLVKANGEVTCNESAIGGKVMANPEAGTGEAEIKIETFTFQGCSSTIGGAGGTVKKVAISNLPVVAGTKGRQEFRIGGNGNETVLEVSVETGAGEVITCSFGAFPLVAKYSNSNGEVEISERINTGGFRNVMNCNCGNGGAPNWKAKYRPLQDETGANKGKQIFIN